MKPLLLPFLAALAIPNAAKAEIYYLYFGNYTSSGQDKVDRYGSTHLNSQPYSSLDKCQAAGENIIKTIIKPVKNFEGRWVCVEN